jgi:hypothetical protein
MIIAALIAWVFYRAIPDPFDSPTASCPEAIATDE